DDFVAGQLAGPFAIQDHVERGAVLYGAAGVEKLGLSVYFDARQIARDSVHADERCIAYHAQKIGRSEAGERGRGGGGDGHITLFYSITYLSVDNGELVQLLLRCA